MAESSNTSPYGPSWKSGSLGAHCFLSSTEQNKPSEMEPRPIGQGTDIVLVEKMPLVDSTWIRDEPLFECLRSLVDMNHSFYRKQQPLHPCCCRGSGFIPPFSSEFDDVSSLFELDDDTILCAIGTDAADGGSIESGGSYHSSRDDHYIKDYQSKQWNEKYQELAEFCKEFGHCLVPHNYTRNLSLGLWVARQRHQYNLRHAGLRSSMTDERELALEGLGFVWDSRKATWEERFHELVLFRKREGHCNVPAAYGENPKLGIWVKCQRRQYRMLRSGKKSNITKDRIEKLTDIGFSWNGVPRKCQRGTV